jgi:antitoxin component YwqK of YwqJK toxin-antitoxin module
MKFLIAFFPFFFCSLTIQAWQCQLDDRTLTELLFGSDRGTIFTCEVISEILPIYTEVKIDTTIRKGINLREGLVSDRNDLNRFQYYVKVKEIYFGKIDSSVVKLISMYGFKVGSNYLVYSKGTGKDFFAGGPCERRTKLLTNSIEILNELQTISTFSNIVNRQKTRKITIRNIQNTIVTEGKFKKGKPVGKWRFYYDNLMLKVEINLLKKTETRYYNNNRIQLYKFYKKDTLCYYQYKNDSANCLDIIEKDIPIVKDKQQKWYFEIYENCIIKQKHTQENGVGFVDDYIEYYSNGKTKNIGKYKNGKKIGEWTEYNENGTILKTESF